MRVRAHAAGPDLFHDHGLYAREGPARPRGACAHPRPAPGHRTVGSGGCPGPSRISQLLGFGPVVTPASTAGLPVPLTVAGEVFMLNDQHAFLRIAPDSPLAPGDPVCLGISHPCTTLDKWRVIPVVADDGTVTDVVHAFF